MTGRIYRTYSSVFVASPSRTLSPPSFAGAPSLIQLGDFSILFSLASSVVLFPLPCIISFPFVSPLFFFFFQFLAYSVYIGTMV